MTEVQKVSIGGYAFTLEVEAYAIVKQYLDELNDYYAVREGGAEVMEGIEERMAELLYEKCADDGVASVAEVQEIIATLGKPSAIESDNDPELKKEEPAAAGEKQGGKKRLYRDPTNKILAGVCSGLAAYFKCDVVLIRIIFIGLTLLTGMVGWRIWNEHLGINLNLSIPVIYLILWIAMPEARTVKQRWEMGIANPPAGGANPQPLGTGLGQVLRIFIGVLLLLTGVAGMTCGVAVSFGQTLFDWNFIQEAWTALSDEVPEMLPLMGSFVFKLVLLLIYFLPMLGMIYGGIMMVFDIKSPSWRPGLVIFLLWVIALVVFIVLALTGLFRAEIWV